MSQTVYCGAKLCRWNCGGECLRKEVKIAATDKHMYCKYRHDFNEDGSFKAKG